MYSVLQVKSMDFKFMTIIIIEMSQTHKGKAQLYFVCGVF